MVTREELSAAVRLIKEHCEQIEDCYKAKCPLESICFNIERYGERPYRWPDPEEGGGE